MNTTGMTPEEIEVYRKKIEAQNRKHEKAMAKKYGSLEAYYDMLREKGRAGRAKQEAEGKLNGFENDSARASEAGKKSKRK